MKAGETPEDIFSQIEGEKQNLPVKRTVTQSSAKVDEGVRTIEEKVLHGQNVINDLLACLGITYIAVRKVPNQLSAVINYHSSDWFAAFDSVRCSPFSFALISSCHLDGSR